LLDKVPIGTATTVFVSSADQVEAIDSRFGLGWSGKGDAKVAALLCSHLRKEGIKSELRQRGVDHGMFLPLSSVFKQSSVPRLLNISISGESPAAHFAIGAALSTFDWPEGTCIVFSGGSVHNTEEWREEFFQDQSRGTLLDCVPQRWAVEFDAFVESSLLKKDGEALLNYKAQKTSNLAHPTADHFMPLLTFFSFVGNRPIERMSKGYTLGSLGLSGFASY
jgi:4,5-DOPA dioxygenase extradiol